MFGKLLVVIALLAVGAAVGCSTAGPDVQTTPTPVGASASPATTSSYRQPGIFCSVDLPDTWRAGLEQGRVILPSGYWLVPFATAADASQIFGALYSDEWSGVVSVTPQSGSIIRIRAFGNPAGDQVDGGDFDGRWLVWAESHSKADWNDWYIRAWDSNGGQTITIATAPRVDSATIQGPLIQPIVSDGKAAWVQSNQAGQGELHLYSLAEGSDRVLPSGRVVPPVAFWGSKLLWTELDSPGKGHLAMVDVATGKLESIPKPLASIHRVAAMATSDKLVAWTDVRSVWIWRLGDAEPSRIFTADPGDHADFIGIAGDLVTWDGANGPSVADLRSRSVSRLTRSYGGRFAKGNALLVYQPVIPVGSALRGPLPLEVRVVSVARLPALPACAS